MKKKEMKRKLKKIERYIDLLDKIAAMARETAESESARELGTVQFFQGTAGAYGLAASGLRIRLMKDGDR